MEQTPSRLSSNAIEWALNHLVLEGDTDLFPKPFELEALVAERDRVVKLLSNINLNNHSWSSGRRFIIPKDKRRFRAATQLDLVDSILLAALTKEYGGQIEQHRTPASDNIAFSYRFSPSNDGRMYAQENGWTSFWSQTATKAKTNGFTHVVVADIADYYNQVYHHTLENQLRACGIPEFAVAAYKNSCAATTERVSRGLPVGPHFVHLLAELCLSPIDRALKAKGLVHCRYVDDFHVFARSEEAANSALQTLVETLDSQQRLALQDTKTEVLSLEQFVERADRMSDDQAINATEEALLGMLDEKTDGNPYSDTVFDDLTEDEKALLKEESITEILDAYLSETPINYGRLRWLLRRLAQVEAPGAMRPVLKNLRQLVPVIGVVSKYIVRASKNWESVWTEDLGEQVANALDYAFVQKNPYLQSILINLVALEPSFNHIDRITARYEESGPPVKREIVLAAAACVNADWIRERKGDVDNADPWLRRALIRAGGALPGDEGEHWIKGHLNRLAGIDRLVASETFKKVNFKFGDDFRLT